MSFNWLLFIRGFLLLLVIFYCDVKYGFYLVSTWVLLVFLYFRQVALLIIYSFGFVFLLCLLGGLVWSRKIFLFCVLCLIDIVCLKLHVCFYQMIIVGGFVLVFFLYGRVLCLWFHRVLYTFRSMLLFLFLYQFLMISTVWHIFLYVDLWSTLFPWWKANQLQFSVFLSSICSLLMVLNLYYFLSCASYFLLRDVNCHAIFVVSPL